MNKPLKDIICSAGFGALSFVLFLCMTNGNATIAGGLIRTVGMAFATAPLIYAGLSFGYSGMIISFIGATAVASFGKTEYFEMFKHIYVLVEMLPAAVIVTAGLPVKGKQMSIGGITSVISIFVASVVGVVCYMINNSILSAYAYDGKTKVSVFLMSVLEKSELGQKLAFTNDGAILKIIGYLMPILPAFIAMAIIGRILLNAYFGLEAALYTKTSRRGKEEYLTFAIPDAAVISTLACLIMALFTKGLESYLYWNLTITVAIPAALAGMVMLHLFCKNRKYGRTYLILFYIIIILTDIYGLVATMVLGIYNWIQHKFIKKAEYKEK